MALQITINPHLSELPTIDYREALESQGKLKDLSKENYDRLVSSIVNQGLLAPFAIWIDPVGKKFLMDGHQRKRMFMMEKVEPFLIPYFRVPGATFDEAKMNLLAITSQYGTVTKEGYQEFTINIPKEWLQENIYFDALSKEFAPKIDLEELEPTPELTMRYFLNIECKDEKHAQELYEKFAADGLTVKIVT